VTLRRLSARAQGPEAVEWPKNLTWSSANTLGTSTGNHQKRWQKVMTSHMVRDIMKYSMSNVKSVNMGHCLQKRTASPEFLDPTNVVCKNLQGNYLKISVVKKACVFFCLGLYQTSPNLRCLITRGHLTESRLIQLPPSHVSTTSCQVCQANPQPFGHNFHSCRIQCHQPPIFHAIKYKAW